MKWFAKMEKKYGRYAIQNLIRYMLMINVAGAVLGLINPMIYYQYLSLDVYQILHGQIWRLVTFLLYPSLSFGGGAFLINLIFYGIMIYVYYWIGGVLEQIWGSFRFNAFYFFGIILTIAAAFIYYFILVHANGSGMAQRIGYEVIGQSVRLDDLNLSMFLVFAFLFPNTQFLLYFIIPIKAKWLGFLYLGFNVYEIVMCFMSRNPVNIMTMFMILASMVDFVIFYLIARHPQGLEAAVRQKKRRVVYKNAAAKYNSQPRHRCVICGRTEKDSPGLEFRYCSKCEGNYEYCSDHLFSHEHVRRM